MDLPNKVRTNLQWISIWTSIMLCAISLLVLAGWCTGYLPLTSVLPGLIPMNPVVAISFFLLALAIGFLALYSETSILQNWEIAAIGAVVAVVAVMRLAAYLGMGNLHVDSILFADELNKVPFAPNRMAPNTAVGLFFGGLGVMSVVWRKAFTRQLTGIAAVGLLLTGLYGIANSLFTFYSVRGRGVYIPTAMHTATALLLVLVGIAAMDEHLPIIRQFIKSSPGGIIMRRLLPPLIILPLLLGWLRIFFEYRLHLSGMPASAATSVVLQIILLGALVWAAAIIMDRLYDQRQQTMQRLEQTKTELIEANAAAQEAARAKSQFLANMSHEIRTPLNGVISMMELLAETPLDGQQRGYTQVARTSADALLAVITDILDFSKIEAGRMEIESVDFDLRACTEDTVYLMLPTAMRKKLELGYDIAPDLPSQVRGDPVRLRQVLMNLISNAIKFTDRGEVWVKLSTEDIAEGRILARFEVHDTGVGIAPEDARKLFTAFAQVHHRGDKVYGGTGLGLAISRQIIELMGGRIELESQVGSGSNFWFAVPLERRKPVWLNADAIPEVLRRQRVLLLMASAVRRDKLQHQLQYWNIGVQTVASVDACLELLRTNSGHPFDVLFVEHQPPELNALEIARLVHAQAVVRAPSIVALARADMHISGAVQREFGLGGVLGKPVRQSQLYDLLMRLVSASGEMPSMPSHAAQAKIQLPAGYQGLKVLVAEDNEINQFVIREVLAGLELQCDVVANGQECINALRKETYALVLMDCLMPVMDGFEAARKIRELEAVGGTSGGINRGRIAIIALTANVTGLDRQNSMEAGMDAFLTKPLDRRQLVSVIESLIENPGIGQAAKASSPEFAQDVHAAPGEATSECEPFDLKRLEDYFSADKAMVERVLGQFIGQGKQQIATLNEHINALNWDAARRAAHAIKGTAACLFAEALRLAAKDLEFICHDHRDTIRAAAAWQKVQMEMNRCIDYLAQRKTSSGKSASE